MKFIKLLLKILLKMARKILDLGTTYDDLSADKLRDALSDCNDNFAELYLINSDYDDQTLKTKSLLIGSWNMDTTPSIKLTMDLTDVDIAGLTAMIKKDESENFYPIHYKNNGSIYSEGTGITLEREGSGFFDGANFDGAGNRGFILLTYYNTSSNLKPWETGYVA